MKIRKAVGTAIIIFVVTVICGCDMASLKDFIEQRVAWYNRDTALYITSTYTGRVYRYDFDTHEAEVWFSTGENGTGAIYFHNDTGYLSVGAASSNPGLYRFDPRLKSPAISRIGNPISAQYVAFYSDTKAYVTDHSTDVTGVYIFNPSNLAAGMAGPIPGTEHDGFRMLQDIIVGLDSKIYVSSYGDNTVLQIAPATDSVSATWDLLSDNPAGLLSRFSGISAYIFVVSTPGGVYRYTPAGSGINVATGLSASRMVYHERTDKYYAMGWSHTYMLTPTDPDAWDVEEIFDGGASFGGTDIVIHDDLVFIAGYAVGTKESYLYVIDTATEAITAYSPVPIMEDGVDGASNMTVY